MSHIDLFLANLLQIPRLKILRIAGGGSKALSAKVGLLCLAAGLSYVVRCAVGGLAVAEPRFQKPENRSKTAKSLRNYRIAALRAMRPVLKRTPMGPLPFVKSAFMANGLVDLVRPILIEADQRNEDELERLAGPLLELVNAVVEWVGAPPKESTRSDIAAFAVKLLAFASPRPNQGERRLSKEELLDWLKRQLRDPALAQIPSRLAQLEVIDIRSNQLEVKGVTVIQKLLLLDKEMHGIDFDGTAWSKVTQFVEFVDFVSQPDLENLTRMSFPVSDRKRLVAIAAPRAKAIVRRDLRVQQLRMQRIVDRNRSEAGELTELPFVVCPELHDLMIRRTKDFADEMRNKQLRSHSGIVEDFQLQLPYLEEDPEFIGLPANYRAIPTTPTMSSYRAPGMRKRFDEFEDDRDPEQLVALDRGGYFNDPEEEEVSEGEEEEEDNEGLIGPEKMRAIMTEVAPVLEDSEVPREPEEEEEPPEEEPSVAPDRGVDRVEAPALNIDDSDISSTAPALPKLDSDIESESAGGPSRFGKKEMVDPLLMTFAAFDPTSRGTSKFARKKTVFFGPAPGFGSDDDL
jgi:hypothetical protein